MSHMMIPTKPTAKPVLAPSRHRRGSSTPRVPGVSRDPYGNGYAELASASTATAVDDLNALSEAGKCYGLHAEDIFRLSVDEATGHDPDRAARLARLLD